MALAETGQLWELCCDMPVRLLIVLHAFLLECGISSLFEVRLMLTAITCAGDC